MTNRKPGRPPEDGARRMTIACKVTAEEHQALSAWASANQCSLGELLRAAALAGLELADERRSAEEIADVPRLPGLATVPDAGNFSGPQMGPLGA